MQELLILFTSILERGLIFSIAIIGMFLSSRVLKFDDLTIEGSFGLGGALTATLLIHKIHPLPSMLIAMLAGGITGLITAALHTKLKLNNLMSGIIVTTALFSISLKVAGANITVSDLTLFHLISEWPFGSLAILSIISMTMLLTIKWLLHTELGFMLQATGANQQMVLTLGKHPHMFITIGLILANMLNALAGSLFVQYVGFFSIWNNVGVLIIAFAGLIIAESLSKKLGINILIAGLLYQAIIATTFELQLDQDWNKMITALLILGLIIWKQKLIKSSMEETC